MAENKRISFADYDGRVMVKYGDTVLASSERVVVVNEADYLPRYYFPMDDVNMDVLAKSDKTSHCPHKGDAVYYHIDVDGDHRPDMAWAYPVPLDIAEPIANMMAFYEERLDVERN